MCAFAILFHPHPSLLFLLLFNGIIKSRILIPSEFHIYLKEGAFYANQDRDNFYPRPGAVFMRRVQL